MRAQAIMKIQVKNCIVIINKLPYKSEIVVPIIPSYAKQYDIIGFLCVDCEHSNKFDPIYDPALIEGVADGIYDILFNRTLNVI